MREESGRTSNNLPKPAFRPRAMPRWLTLMGFSLLVFILFILYASRLADYLGIPLELALVKLGLAAALIYPIVLAVLILPLGAVSV
jgi:hypothetical protein